MKQIIFVRHGESVANAGGITMEHAAIPLSDRGWRQARQVAEHLPAAPGLVLVSPMVRTQQTSEPYCQLHQVQPRTLPVLAEFSVVCPSLIPGLSGEQRKPFVASYWDDADPHRRLGPGADTFLEFAGRVEAFKQQMPELPDRTLIFGHGIWCGLLIWRLLGYSADDVQGMRRFRRFQQGLPMPNCAVFVLTWGGSKWSILADESATQISSR